MKDPKTDTPLGAQRPCPSTSTSQSHPITVAQSCEQRELKPQPVSGSKNGTAPSSSEGSDHPSLGAQTAAFKRAGFYSFDL